ncbi:hypothetical protein KAR91_09910 [Candidatus Pacearchaeota archaeon]|nr:hypothetical protein [Candidatus Pacearchaeota archaeon]
MGGIADRNGDAYGVADITVDLGSVAANTTEEETVTVPGLTTDMYVMVNKPSLDAGIGIAGARVSAANTLILTVVNSTAGAVDASSETYKLFWFKPNQTDSGAVKL